MKSKGEGGGGGGGGGGVWGHTFRVAPAAVFLSPDILHSSCCTDFHALPPNQSLCTSGAMCVRPLVLVRGRTCSLLGSCDGVKMTTTNIRLQGPPTLHGEIDSGSWNCGYTSGFCQKWGLPQGQLISFHRVASWPKLAVICKFEEKHMHALWHHVLLQYITPLCTGCLVHQMHTQIPVLPAPQTSELQ